MDLIESYLRLALAMDDHIPGYLDSYAGPPEWKEERVKTGPVTLPDLTAQVENLVMALEADTSLDPQRRDYLLVQARSMLAQTLILMGEMMSLPEEAEKIYDITPEWIEEPVFDQANQVLDDLLPGSGSLVDRLAAHKKTYEVKLDSGQAYLDRIAQELRRRTKDLFGLPPGEMFELKLVSEQPWSAYNWYLGELRSRIEINTDLPVSALGLIRLLAHEGYPGHHTELSTKEYQLGLKRGWLEHQIQILYSPAALISEGIATRALETLIPQAELADWLDQEIFPLVGLDHLPASLPLEVEKARRPLNGVLVNLAFILHHHNASEAEALAYGQRHYSGTDKELTRMIRFVQAYRGYTFTYYYGGEILDRLFDAQGDRHGWFRRLLREPVTPRQVRAWTEGVSS
jgi:hypothetical protein